MLAPAAPYVVKVDITGTCVVGTKVHLMKIDTATVIQTFTIKSTSNCHCEFAKPFDVEKYCIKVTPTQNYKCADDCTTKLTTGSTTVVTTLIKKTTTVEKSTTITAPDVVKKTTTIENTTTTTTTVKIQVNLFYDANNDGDQDATDPNLTNLKITLKDGGGKELQVFTSECEDKVFGDLPPGNYTIVAQQARGYTCNCESTIKVTAGKTAKLDFLYLKN